MKRIRKYDLRKTPDMLKRQSSMDSLLMPTMRGLTDSGFSVDLTEQEMMDVIEMFQEFEVEDEKDN